MSPATHVRIVLTEAKAREWPFELAWQSAVRSLSRIATSREERFGWLDALKYSKPAFCAYYENVQVKRIDVTEEHSYLEVVRPSPPSDAISGDLSVPDRRDDRMAV